VASVVDIRLLRPDDDRLQLRSGEPAIDRYFHHYAAQNQFKLHIGATWVATIEERIVSFATVTMATIDRETLPSAAARRRMPAYPIPVLRLARMGVDERLQGGGIGRIMLNHIFRLAIEQRDRIGCVGVLTDAKPQAIGFYQKLGFIPLEGVRTGLLHGAPMPMYLAIGTIASALEGG